MTIPEDDIIAMAVCIEETGNNLNGMKKWRLQTEPYPDLLYSKAVLDACKEMGLATPPRGRI